MHSISTGGRDRPTGHPSTRPPVGPPPNLTSMHCGRSLASALGPPCRTKLKHLFTVTLKHTLKLNEGRLYCPHLLSFLVLHNSFLGLPDLASSLPSLSCSFSLFFSFSPSCALSLSSVSFSPLFSALKGHKREDRK